MEHVIQMSDTEDDGYTPGTSEIRAAWVAWYDGKDSETPSWHVNEFDRWLRAHDNEVANKVWVESMHAVQNAINDAIQRDGEVGEETTLYIMNPYFEFKDDDDAG